MTSADVEPLNSQSNHANSSPSPHKNRAYALNHFLTGLFYLGVHKLNRESRRLF